MNCLNPIEILVEHSSSLYGDGSVWHKIYVPCGRCELCMSKKRNEWLFRLKATAKAAHDCYFLTLTYDNEHLPKRIDNGKWKVQRFMKRFRKNNNLPDNFKYYLISELGGKFGRLHYHAIFFNTGMKLQELWEVLPRDWQQGRTHAVYVNEKRLHYVAKAHLQNVNKPKSYYTNKELPNGISVKVKVKPVNYFFMCCSKGIGIELLTPGMVQYIRERGDFTIVDHKGKVRQLPSYYLLKVYDENEDVYLDLKESRLKHTIEEYNDEQELLLAFRSQCIGAARGTHSQPREPLRWQERRLKAERIRKTAKKYRFTEPPDWFE